VLKIRKEQMEVFRESLELAFVELLISHVRKHHGDAVGHLPEELLRFRVIAGIARARDYGLTWESSIGGFVALQFVIAPRFDEQPAIHRALTDNTRPSGQRMDALIGAISASDWFDAMSSPRFSAWPGEA